MTVKLEGWFVVSLLLALICGLGVFVYTPWCIVPTVMWTASTMIWGLNCLIPSPHK